MTTPERSAPPAVCALKGTLATLAPGATLEDAETRLSVIPRATILIDAEGRVLAAGPADEVPIPEGVQVSDHGDSWILPGFVDLHVHFPQIWCTDAHGGGRLLDWLERCVFPMEARLADPVLARRAAADFTRALASSGTCTALVFGSQFEVAQDALFEALDARGLRAIVGRSTMTEGPPSAAPLLTDLDTALRMTEAEIRAHHPRAEDGNRALLGVAIIPRFCLSLTREGLARFGDLHAAWRDAGVWFTTHLSENADPGDGEIQLVKEAFGVRDYLDTYDGRFLPGSRQGGESFLGRRSVFAHAVHCTPRELARLAETRSGIAHCPVSQQFLGSGLMPIEKVREAGIEIGLGSDIGAGDRFCIAEVANTAFKVHMNGPRRHALGPGALLWLATLGGARVLDLEDRIGTLTPGRDADLVVVDPSRAPHVAARLELAGAADASRLFTLLMATTPELIVETRVQGRIVATD